MKRLRRKALPEWTNVLLAVLAAICLILSFPDFDFWFLAWFAFIPLFFAVERQKESIGAGLILGWTFGIVFFMGTCWWLTFAPITYAGFPPPLAYFLLFCATAVAGVFTAIFAGLLSFFLGRFGSTAVLTAPAVWILTEFLRFWLTGNNWNALGYSQAFGDSPALELASLGGVYFSGAVVVLVSACLYVFVRNRQNLRLKYFSAALAIAVLAGLFLFEPVEPEVNDFRGTNLLIAIQPNVPMSGLTAEKWRQLREKHVMLAESALGQLPSDRHRPTTVIFPESPMNFMYEEDEEFQQFVSEFAAKHNVNILFNSAEPDPENKKYFNSAVLVDTRGKEIVQYDKIYLVPFGESVPAPLQPIIPPLVGSFSFGKNYNLLPFGDAKAGVMICFESHFGELSREFVRRGADVIIEMTNDGYLGPTPVLRQHLANAVFRAVETNRPVFRATNVGITAHITRNGEVIEPTRPYTEDTRIWTFAKSDGSQTIYVKYGDWFAWLCCVLTIGLMIFGLARKPKLPQA